MCDEKSKEFIFKEKLDVMVEVFGEGSQEGAKLALKTCQEEFAFVSISSQRQIAEAFGMQVKIIETLMKFMPSIKKSKIEYEIVCCTGPRCAKNGSIEVLKAVRSITGLDFNETSKDGKVRLSTQACFKQCKCGPNIMINGKFYNNMDRKKVKKVLEELE